jgi:hypothetical protein
LVGLGGWIQTFLLEMECRVSQSDKGWDPAVVLWYGATKFPFTKEGEGSRGQTKHGRQANEGVCETFDLLFCCAKRRQGSSSSGLNKHLWAPGFALPTIGALLRALELDTFMADSDIGEMFLHFMLEERCARLAGVYLTHYVERGEGALEGKIHLVRWGRCLMGGTFSPYKTGQGMGHAKEMIMGDPNDEQNVYQWKEVRLNLP